MKRASIGTVEGQAVIGLKTRIAKLKQENLPWRADGHDINVGGRHGFNSFGVQPTLQYRLGEHWVGAFGCLFTVVGQNTLDAIYPNFSIYYYWSQTGKVIMR